MCLEPGYIDINLIFYYTNDTLLIDYVYGYHLNGTTPQQDDEKHHHHSTQPPPRATARAVETGSNEARDVAGTMTTTGSLR